MLLSKISTVDAKDSVLATSREDATAISECVFLADGVEHVDAEPPVAVKRCFWATSCLAGLFAAAFVLELKSRPRETVDLCSWFGRISAIDLTSIELNKGLPPMP